MKVFRVVINSENTSEVGIVFSLDGLPEHSGRTIVSLDPIFVKSILEAAQQSFEAAAAEVESGTAQTEMSGQLQRIREKKSHNKILFQEAQEKLAAKEAEVVQVEAKLEEVKTEIADAKQEFVNSQIRRTNPKNKP